MNSSDDDLLKLINNLKFDEAISHSVHSRVFEILGYLSLLRKEKLPNELVSYVDSIENLNKKLVSEIHLIIDFYKSEDNKLKNTND